MTVETKGISFIMVLFQKGQPSQGLHLERKKLVLISLLNNVLQEGILLLIPNSTVSLIHVPGSGYYVKIFENLAFSAPSTVAVIFFCLGISNSLRKYGRYVLLLPHKFRSVNQKFIGELRLIYAVNFTFCAASLSK